MNAFRNNPFAGWTRRQGKPVESGLRDAMVETLESRTLMSGGASSVQAHAWQPADAYTVDLHPAKARTGAAGGAVGGGHSNFAAFASGPVRIDANDDIITFIGIRDAQVNPRTAGGVMDARGARALAVSSGHSFAGRPPERPALPAAAGRHVLVVEDDASSRLALSVILRNRGWKVTVAGTLAEGMSKLNSRPDNVIVDLMLPDGDGTQLLQHVRDAHLPTRVTVTTGVTDPQRLEQVRRLRPEALLTKPLNLADLMRGLSAAA